MWILTIYMNEVYVDTYHIHEGSVCGLWILTIYMKDVYVDT